MNEQQAKYLTEHLLKVGVLTGSKLLGNATDTCDIDIVVTETELNYVCSILNLTLKYNDTYTGVNSTKYTYKNDVIDILVVDDSNEKKLWKDTTDTYLELIDTSVPIHKSLRVALFETIKNNIKPF